jgi:hypothetical protein
VAAADIVAVAAAVVVVADAAATAVVAAADAAVVAVDAANAVIRATSRQSTQAFPDGRGCLNKTSASVFCTGKKTGADSARQRAVFLP